MMDRLKLEIGKMDVRLIGGYGCIVHSCLIVDYFSVSSKVTVFRINGL